MAPTSIEEDLLKPRIYRNLGGEVKSNEEKSILIVDDIPLMRIMLAKYVRTLGLKILREELSILGIEIFEASNGVEALECLKNYSIDLVFLDLMMPEMDGITFLQHKKENPTLSSIPVIACSALGERDAVEKATALGASSYIVKPFTLKSVEEKFRAALTIMQP